MLGTGNGASIGHLAVAGTGYGVLLGYLVAEGTANGAQMGHRIVEGTAKVGFLFEEVGLKANPAVPR